MKSIEERFNNNSRPPSFHLCLFLCALLFIPSFLHADASVSLHSGISSSGYREETYSKILQYANTAPFNIDASIRGKVLEHSLRTNFTFAKNTSSVSGKRYLLESFDEYTGKKESKTHTESIYSISSYLQYGLTGICRNRDAHVSRIGGFLRIDADIQLANYPSVSVISAFGPLYDHNYRITPEDRITFSGQAALITWAVRPPYAGADAQLMNLAASNPLGIIATGDLVFPDKYRSILGSITYYRTLTKHLEFLVSFQAHYSYIDIPLPRAEAGISLTAGLNANF